MKRKLLNAALFGAVLIAAPVSTFVSCADYDADINILNQQIEDLEGIVKQKEEAINQQLEALKAQDKLLAEKDAALEEALKQCKIDCAGKLAEAKAECAAARAGLQASINALEEALEKAKTDHAADVASLMAKDAELQGKIDAVKTYAEGVQTNLTNLSNQLEEFKTHVANTYATKEELKTEAKKLQDQIDAIKGDITKIQGDIKTINETLTDAVTRLGKAESAITKLREDLDKAVADLGGKIAANKAEIDALKKVLDMQEDGTSKTIEDLKKADAKLAKDLEDAVAAIRGGYTGSMKDLKDLIDGITTRVADLESRATALEGRVDVIDAQVLKNTKAIADLVARYVALDEEVSTLNKYVGTPATDEAAATGLFKEIEDLKAVDVEVWLAIENIYKKEGSVESGVLIEKYQACLAAAKEYADGVAATAKSEAISEANGYTDGKIDGLRTELEGKITVVSNALNDFKTLVANTYATKTELSDAKTEITNAYKAADEQLYTKLHGEITALESSLTTLINNTASSLSKELKSLVLEPASYYDGIQAIEGAMYVYNKWDISNGLAPVQTTDVTKYCPEVIANYHLNPSTANINTAELDRYSYAVLDRTNRGVNNDLKPVVKKAAVDNGMLALTLQLTDAEANKTPLTHEHGTVTVMALQYNNKEAKGGAQTITSDYAVLYLNPLTQVSLVGAVDGHDLAESAATVTSDDHGYVQYDDEAGYNIEKHIKTSFGGEDPLSRADSKWPGDFEYEFTWVSGDRTYFTEIDKNGQIYPQLPGKGKGSATTACVGKTATWRIDVKHGNEIAEVGFYTVTITGKAIIETADPTTTTVTRALTCIDDKIIVNEDLAVDNVWNKVVELTGEDLATVKGKYAITLNSAGKVQQFDKYTSAENNTYYEMIAGKGVISVKGDKINWQIANNAPAMATIDKVGDQIVTYIRVRSLAQISDHEYNEFYLPVVWAPAVVEKWPADQTATWTYNKWDLQWQANDKTNESEIRMYADLTAGEGGGAPYSYDVLGKAIKNDGSMKVELDDPAKSFVNHEEFEDLKNLHFRFIEHPNAAARKMVVDGVTYNLTINEAGTSLYANGTEIATISATGTVDLLNNPTSRKLLNAYEKNELAYGQTLCVRVGYAVESCGGKVRVKNGDFDVRFVKPVTFVKTPIVISDTDGVGGAVIVNFLKNLVCFNENTFDIHDEYFGIFGVTISIPNATEWKTNYDGKNFENTLAGTGMEGNFFVEGTATNPSIKYKNNTAVVSDFAVRVPVTLNYVWGDAQTYEVEIQIKRTLNNSNRR